MDRSHHRAADLRRSSRKPGFGGHEPIADRSLCCRSCRAVNDLEVRYGLVEATQYRSCFRFDNRLLRLPSREPTDCPHRFPKGRHGKLDSVVHRPAEQVYSPMSFDGLERRKDFCRGVVNIRPLTRRSIAPSTAARSSLYIAVRQFRPLASNTVLAFSSRQPQPWGPLVT